MNSLVSFQSLLSFLVGIIFVAIYGSQTENSNIHQKIAYTLLSILLGGVLLSILSLIWSLPNE